jgi:hypothetical protein
VIFLLFIVAVAAGEQGRSALSNYGRRLGIGCCVTGSSWYRVSECGSILRAMASPEGGVGVSAERGPNQSLHLTAMNFAVSLLFIAVVAAGEQQRSAAGETSCW